MFSKDNMLRLTKAMETRLQPSIRKIASKALETNSWMVKLIEFYQEEMGSDSDSDSSSGSSGSGSSSGSAASSVSVAVNKKSTKKVIVSSSGSNASRSLSEHKSSKLSVLSKDGQQEPVVKASKQSITIK